MAERMIRKKLNITVVEALVADLETGSTGTVKIDLQGRHRFNEKKLLKEVQKKLPAEVKVLKITGIEIFSETRVMSEKKFIANSEKEN